MRRWTDRRNLVLVGHNPWNRSKRSAKGYVIRRIGRAIVIEWGSIVFDNRGRVAKPRWRGRAQYRLYVCSNVASAVERLQKLMREQIMQGYSRAGGSIGPPKVMT